MASLPVIQVACGVLQAPDGRVLIAQRPAGKVAAGKWEFPGGKIEPGETARAALVRELHEELGVDLRALRPLIRFTHAYADRVVVLDTWLVTGWDGQPQGREAQSFTWCDPGQPTHLDLLPTVAPILRALLLPVHYVFTPPDAGERVIRERLPGLPRGALLRLRLPALDDAAYAQLAHRLQPQVAAAGLRLVLDRDPQSARDLGAAGWHASERQRHSAGATPGLLQLASCHDAAGLADARERGFDAAVLGPVQATATHPGAATLGWEGFAALAHAASLPVYAIGGVGPADLERAWAHGAQGVAAISAYWSLRGS